MCEIILEDEKDYEINNDTGKWRLKKIKANGVRIHELIEPSAQELSNRDKIQEQKENEDTEFAVIKEMNRITRQQAIQNLKDKGELPEDYNDR